ncbi:MAG TPA: hypothetical protein VK302_10325 [Terriglobales bacterium]|nr:hypothetical protein [Terriglobales bacterium]
MSVIPFVMDGPNPTLVAREDLFRPDGDSMLILNLDESQLEGDKPNASYDLRIGRAYKDYREQERWTLPERGKIILLPGGAVLIETEEQVWLPHSMLGYIVPKVKLLQDGVSNTLSKVDPGYHDHLVVTVFNLGKKEITLIQGQPFCALVVHDVGTGVRPRTGPGKKIEGRTGVGAFPRLWDRIEARPGLLAFLSALLALGLVVGELLVHTWMYNHPHRPESGKVLVEPKAR